MWRGFAVGLVEQGGKMVAQGATIPARRVVCIAGNLAAKTGRDFEGFAGVGKAHLVRVARIHAFEVLLGGLEEGFGQGVLAVAEGFGAGGGIEKLLALDGAGGFGVLLGELSGVVFDAAAPIEVTGPAFDGAEGGADFSANGGVAAFGAELQVGAESLEGAGGLAGGLREKWLRVEG